MIQRVRTPLAAQRFLNALPYNTEPPPGRALLRSFRGVVRSGVAHCLEAAIACAVVLEQHGYPPLVMSLESVDGLDHVIFVYRERGRWGSVAKSRDPGLHGRRPVFPSLRRLADSYFDGFIDRTGCLRAYGVVDLRALKTYDWRLAPGNVWKVERLLFEIPHRPIRRSPARVAWLRARYLAAIATEPDRKPMYYDERNWTEIPASFRKA
ncbi:MAG TPA: hypothetical protein VFV78_03780 [Vicinamibacterales bacterium]|nr:hypothetical protein [Vicinamibacterales bacterium]